MLGDGEASVALNHTEVARRREEDGAFHLRKAMWPSQGWNLESHRIDLVGKIRNATGTNQCHVDPGEFTK
jgi:hypothetical protein